MTKEEIIRMAREAGLVRSGDNWTEPARWGEAEIARFAALVAALVAAAEREACAKVCDGLVDAEYKTGKVDHNEMGWTQACAAAIRARRRG